MNSCNCPNQSTTSNNVNQTVHRPPFHTEEHEHGIRLQVALPGVRKEDLKLTLHQSNLTIEADRHQELPENWKTLRESNSPRSYGLNVRLAARLDGTKTSASFENGVLTLQVPVREEAKPRQIHVA